MRPLTFLLAALACAAPALAFPIAVEVKATSAARGHSAADAIDGEGWCAARSPAAGEELALRLGTPRALAAVEVELDESSPDALAVATDDGRKFAADKLAAGKATIAIGGEAVRGVTIRIAHAGKGACIRRVALLLARGQAKPEPAYLIPWLTQAELSAAMAALKEIAQALRECDGAALSERVALPLGVEEPQSSDDEESPRNRDTRYRTLAAVAKACEERSLGDGFSDYAIVNGQVVDPELTRVKGGVSFAVGPQRLTHLELRRARGGWKLRRIRHDPSPYAPD